MLSSRLQSKSRSFVNRIDRIKSFNPTNIYKKIKENFSTKNLLSQVLSIFLMVTMLTSSTPAAPEYVIASANEMGRDIRYAYLTNTYLAQLSEINLTDNPIFAFFFGKGKQQRVARIEVSPREAVIKEGEKIVFTAVAYDSGNNPIQGVSFRWRAVDEKQRTPQLNLLNGEFDPQFSGVFFVTAEAGGINATTPIVVLRDTKLRTLKEHDENDKAKGEGKVKIKKRPKDVEDEMAKPRPAPVNNSSRMSPQQAAQLGFATQASNEQDSEPARENNSKASDEVRYLIEPEADNPTNTEKTRGGPRETIETTEESPVMFLGGAFNQVDPADQKAKGTAQHYSGGAYGAAVYIAIYIDGPVGTGTYAGYTACYSIGGQTCGWNFTIPTQFQNGVPHTAYAYASLNYGGTDMLLTGSPKTFTLGGSGDPNWNNNNFTTADDPGKQTGNAQGCGKGLVCIDPIIEDDPEPRTTGAASGNFGFSAPIVSLGGRGMGVNLSLNYNSLLWHQGGTNITYDIDKGWPAPGWNLGFGKLMDMDSNGGSMLESIDGSRHSYEGTIQAGSGGYSTYYGHTTDGSFIDYISYRAPTGITGGTAWMSNGTVVSYGASNGKVAYPTQIKDRHGNYISISYVNNQGPRIANVVDNLNRTITFNYDTSNRLITVTGPGYNGTTQTYVRLHYTSQTLGATFTGLNPIPSSNTTVDQIDSIFYPVKNTGYWFGDSNSYSSYGMMAKVIEQTGMSSTGTTNNQGTVTQGTMTRQIVYNYPMTPSGLSGAPQYSTTTETWANMDTAAAVTTYSITNTPGAPRTSTVTLPNGTQIKQYSENLPNQWNDGMLFKTETIAPGGAVLSRQQMSWAIGSYGAARLTQVLNTDELGQITKQTFAYGQYYNQVTSTSDFGYGTSSYRTGTTTYENGTDYRGNYIMINGIEVFSSGRHIFNLPKISDLLDAGNVRQSRSEVFYDQFALVNTPGVLQYDDTYNPYTTQTYQGGCVNWEWDEWLQDYVCTQYEELSIYDPATAKRGNVTTSTVYSDAANLGGAISYVNTYDITGNNRTATTNCCQQMSFHYSTLTQYSQPDWHRKGSATDPNLYMTESATYDPNTGVMLTSTDFNNRTTSYAYDSITRPIQTTFPTLGKTTTEYFDASLSVRQTTMESNNNIVSQSQVYLNGRGQPVNSQQLAGAQWNAVATKYDEMGRTSQTSLPYVSTGSPSQWTTVAYDALSRPTQSTAPDGSTSKTFYNETSGGQLVRPSSAIPGAPGNTVRSQDAWGRERWARTDAFGRLEEVVEPDSLGNGSVFSTGNVPTTYLYYPTDKLYQINQGVQQRVFKYDSLGRMTHQKLAEQTGTLNDAGVFNANMTTGWSDVFFYDTRSNLIQRVDARGVKTNFVYNNDPLNRLQSISFDKSTADTSKPIWDVAPVTMAYMTSGDKTRVATVATAGVSTETNTYDSQSRIQFYSISMFGKSAMTTEYAYDTVNRLTSVTYPTAYGTPLSPKVITPTYDNASRLMQMNVNGGAQLSDIVYNPLSQVTSLKTGAATGNADIEQYSYDAQTALVTNQKVLKANTNQTLLDLSYNYNRGLSNGSLNGRTGNLTQIINNLDRNKDRVYEYDALGRLRTAKGGLATGVTGVTANWTQQYGYDRYGNRLSVSGTGITANSQAIPTDGLPNLSYADQTNRIATAGYEYDKAGNQTKGQSPTGVWQRFEYDAAGRLVNVKADDNVTVLEEYAYGASRQRLRTIAGSLTTYYAWGGSSVQCEYTETTNNPGTFKFTKSYIYAGNRLLSTQTWNGSAETTEFHHPDRLGTKLVTNNTANTSTEQNSLPFGTMISSETTANTNQKFTSYDRSSVTGIDYAVNRSYSSGQSRFTTVDPIQMEAVSVANPQSLNLFAYVQNNPVDFVDPSGLDGEPIVNGFSVLPEFADWVWQKYGRDVYYEYFFGDAGMLYVWDDLFSEEVLKKAYETFKEGGCGAFAKEIGLDITFEETKFRSPRPLDPIMNEKLEDLGFTKEDIGEAAIKAGKTLGDAKDMGHAISNPRTKTTYVFYTAADPVGKYNEWQALGNTLFHETLHQKYGSHEKIAQALGLKYDRKNKNAAERDASADKAINAFLDGGCKK